MILANSFNIHLGANLCHSSSSIIVLAFHSKDIGIVVAHANYSNLLHKYSQPPCNAYAVTLRIVLTPLRYSRNLAPAKFIEILVLAEIEACD